MTQPICLARRHGTAYAARWHDCTCPEALAARRRQRATVPSAIPTGSRRMDIDTCAHRARVVARMTIGGRSAREIALHLGISERTVVRYRTNPPARAQKTSNAVLA